VHARARNTLASLLALALSSAAALATPPGFTDEAVPMELATPVGVTAFTQASGASTFTPVTVQVHCTASTSTPSGVAAACDGGTPREARTSTTCSAIRSRASMPTAR
jgi:hypothetical protein